METERDLLTNQLMVHKGSGGNRAEAMHRESRYRQFVRQLDAVKGQFGGIHLLD